MDIGTGTVIGGYVVRGRLGSGGMGAVYLARHPTLPRDVALKVLHPGLAATPAVRARFEREAELLSRLSHPNVVDVLDRGQQGDLLWMAVQYVAGPDLAAVLAEHGPMPPPRALGVVAAVADALDHAHACGLLHRDVKPSNVLLAQLAGGGERVVLTDFGIGQDTAAPDGLTRTGEVVASVAYAAPEQLLGGPLDARTDVYALTAVLFELLTGRRAVEAASLPALLYAVAEAPPPDVRAVRPDLPPALSEVLARGMARDPARRYPTCGALVAAARACFPARSSAPETSVGQLPPPPPPGLPGPGPRPRRRRAVVVGAAAGAAVVLAVALLAVLQPWRTDPPATAAGSPTGDTTGDPTAAWGGLQPIVEDFPSLLPPTPEDPGWGNGTCSATRFRDDTHADAGITCAYPNGMTAEVAHYPDEAARDARRAELEQVDAPGSPGPWEAASSTGTRLLSEDGGSLTWQWLQFDQPDKALYVVIASWPGHDHAELDGAFLRQAPFGGPAGS